ncbi:MAG TPA: amino acid permease [Vicinamibacterales bacterium]|nr:amino acid permease [Vicinamibacterales bacterium]
MSFKRALGPFDATMVVIGGIIGSGIFINPYIVAQRLDSPALVLGAWVAGGAIALAGAFSYAELGAQFPKAGGQYVYLRDAYHPLAGFLYGWALLALIESGAIAAVAITFANYALRLVGRPDIAPVPLAIAAVVVLSIINFLGVKPGSRVLNVLVLLKVGALAMLIVAGWLAPPSPGWWSASRETQAAGLGTAVSFGAALIPILFAYGGWQNANYIAEEIDDPRRNLPLSLLAGTAAVVVIYVLVNLVYLRALGLEGLAATTTPASRAASGMFGPWGDRFVTAAIAISTFGFLDLAILAPTRVYYAMAADGVFIAALAKLHPVYRTPWLAILIQSTWSCILAATGSYERLLNYVVFADWIFFGLTVGTVLVFRRRVPVVDRRSDTYRAPGYPVVQIVFVVIAAAVVLSVVRNDPSSALRGALLLAAGVPVFLWFRARIPGKHHVKN